MEIDFKLDNVKYCTKKTTDKIRESHHCIKFKNKSLLGAYARSAANKSFIRRIYHFMDSISQSKFTLVHYRECKDKDDADNSRLVIFFYSSYYFDYESIYVLFYLPIGHLDQSKTIYQY